MNILKELFAKLHIAREHVTSEGCWWNLMR